MGRSTVDYAHVGCPKNISVVREGVGNKEKPFLENLGREGLKIK